MSKKKLILLTFILFISIPFIFIFYPTISFSHNFYVSNSGNDNNSGLSEAQPWKTISKVNKYNLKPGDVVHFKCGDIWREQLTPKSGDKNGSITYTYYGTGNKPSLYGSVSKSSTSDWKEITTNIWTITDQNIYGDVGNIIFNDGESCGIKVFNESELTSQNKFWYDKYNKTIKIYSLKNPAEMYSKIECAVTKDIINESNKSYVVYNGLDLKFGGAHGIAGSNTHNISILNCDISYVGGGELVGQANSPVRYGNGIEFWDNAHDNLVEGCYIWEIYDSGLTNQGNGSGIQQYNITYRNNTIKNAEWSYEYWNSGSNAKTYNILFENNICSNAGYSWGNSQRSDPTGFNLRLYSNTADISNFVISNNKFENAKQYAIYVYPTAPWKGIESLQFKNNSYSQSNEKIAPNWLSKTYPLPLN